MSKCVNSCCLLDNAYTGIHVLQTSVTEVSQAGAGIYESLEGAGDLTEDKPHRVINTDFLLVNYTDLLIGARSPRKPHYCFPLCALAAAATQSSLWCPDFPHCSNLPSSAAPLHRAGPHNTQMVAIVQPRPLPQSVEQEALLCMPEGQEAWLTDPEPSEKPKKHTQGYFYVYTSLTF